jgi:hypothetical protein
MRAGRPGCDMYLQSRWQTCGMCNRQRNMCVCVLCVGVKARKVRMPTFNYSQPPVPPSSSSPPLPLPHSLPPLAPQPPPSCCHAQSPPLPLSLLAPLPSPLPAAATQPAFSAAAPPPSCALSSFRCHPAHLLSALCRPAYPHLPAATTLPNPTSPSRQVGAQLRVLLFSVFLGSPPNDSPHHGMVGSSKHGVNCLVSTTASTHQRVLVAAGCARQLVWASAASSAAAANRTSCSAAPQLPWRVRGCPLRRHGPPGEVQHMASNRDGAAQHAPHAVSSSRPCRWVSQADALSCSPIRPWKLRHAGPLAPLAAALLRAGRCGNLHLCAALDWKAMRTRLQAAGASARKRCCHPAAACRRRCSRSSSKGWASRWARELHPP